jgi:hypothetical protein
VKCEFEEKDFEAPLYAELLRGSHRIATPGQVFEGRFGIDAALEALNPKFWHMFGYKNPLEGVVLDHFNWGFVWRQLGRRRLLPTFSVNLLVQAKRPEIRQRATGGAKAQGIKGVHWCFDVTSHQHSILIKIARRLGRRALVIYASPAFDKLAELYDHTDKMEVVDNSSFVRVLKLAKHQRWAYSAPGTTGVGHSDPELIEDVSFEQMLAELRTSRIEGQLPAESLEFLAKAALAACESEETSNPVAYRYLQQAGRIRESLAAELAELPAVASFLEFLLFCHVVGVDWLVP